MVLRAVALGILVAIAGCLGNDAQEPAPPAEDDSTLSPTDDGQSPEAPAEEPSPEPPKPATNATAPPPPPPVPEAPIVELAFGLSGFYPLNPAYDPPSAEVAAGSMVKVTFTNSDLNPLGKHDWTLEGVEGAQADVIDQSASTTIEFPAPEPGEYAYYCSVEGHRGFGMEGVLVVT